MAKSLGKDKIAIGWDLRFPVVTLIYPFIGAWEFRLPPNLGLN
jgi:hypothetical protein